MIPTKLIRMIRHDEKKYMINSSGFFREYALTRASTPNIKKSKDRIPMMPFFPHHDHEPMRSVGVDDLFINDFKLFIIDLFNFFFSAIRPYHNPIAIKAMIPECPFRYSSIF
jgi:hypothetical protein